MRLLAFDIEGYLFSDTDKAPKPVCCSWADESRVWITDPGSMETAVAWAQPDNLFVGQNIAYDIICMLRWHPKLTPDIIRALDEGRVFDTAMRERLLHLKEFGGKGYPMFPSLKDLALKYLKLDLSADKSGPDIWRMKYGTLDGVPFNQWPKAALDYAMGDARHTYDVFQAQGGVRNIQATEILQVQAAVVLQAIGTWGFAVNQEKRLKIKTALEAKTVALHAKVDSFQWIGTGSQKRMMDLVSYAWHYKHFKILQDRGAVTGVMFDLPTWEAAFAKTTNIPVMLAQAAANGRPPAGMLCAQGVDWRQWIKEALISLPSIPTTKKGPSFAGEVLEQLGDVVPEFASLTELRHLEKMLSVYVDSCEGKTVHPNYVPMVSTGRTGANDPAIQTYPRKDDDRPDEAFRTMFEAREGMVLGTSDYSQLELCTLVATFRTMFPGVHTALGTAIDDGKDVHCITGGMIKGLSYEEMMAGKNSDKQIKDYRQGAKACNFGLPGGLGAGAFVAYAKSQYGVTITMKDAWKYIHGWKRTWPEIPQLYLKHWSDQTAASPHQMCTSYTITGRQKAQCYFTESSNYPFQGLAADGAKASLWAIWKEQMLGFFWDNNAGSGFGLEFRDSPLNQSRLVAFIHDEIVSENPKGEQGKAALKRQDEIMVAEMLRICQHKTTIRVASALSDAWEH